MRRALWLLLPALLPLPACDIFLPDDWGIHESLCRHDDHCRSGYECLMATSDEPGRCVPRCGDNRRVGYEPCDGSDLGTATCRDYGLELDTGAQPGCVPAECFPDLTPCGKGPWLDAPRQLSNPPTPWPDLSVHVAGDRTIRIAIGSTHAEDTGPEYKYRSHLWTIVADGSSSDTPVPEALDLPETYHHHPIEQVHLMLPDRLVSTDGESMIGWNMESPSWRPIVPDVGGLVPQRIAVVGNLIVLADKSQAEINALLWDTSGGQPDIKRKDHQSTDFAGNLEHLEVNQAVKSEQWLIATSGNVVQPWKVNSQAQLNKVTTARAALPAPFSKIRRVALDPDGTMAAFWVARSTSDPGEFWFVPTAALASLAGGPGQAVTPVIPDSNREIRALAMTSTQLILGTELGSLVLYCYRNQPDGPPIVEYKNEVKIAPGAIDHLALSQDQGILAVAFGDKILIVRLGSLPWPLECSLD
jgi:hypothetical protein